jgi:hypothetical protein
MTLRFALLLIFGARSWACMCSGTWPSVKQAWKDAPAVFLGTVEIADPDGDGRQVMFLEQSVRIRIDEAFKGVSGGQTIELHQGADDCSAKFRTGERAVFYLYPGTSHGSWSVPPCTHALGSAEPTGDDLLFLRGLPKSAIGTRLSGEVELYEDSPTQAFKRVAGVPNVRVKIFGPLGFTREVVTNVAGTYELYGLHPGRYSVSIEVPRGLRIRFPLVTGSAPVQGNGAAVELHQNGGASVKFVLQADTQLSGRTLDAKGKPMTGVCIDLEPLEGRGEDGALFFNCSKVGGVFKMEMMPPGKYWLVARDEVRLDRLRSKSTLYYPGVRDRERAMIVPIEAGNYLDHLDIRLPSDEKRYRIAGRFQFMDGAPVADATVTFTSPQSGYSETTNTGADGLFGLSVVAGMEGQLRGQAAVLSQILRSCPEFRVEPRRSVIFRFMDASPISLSVDSDHEDLNLELTSPSCKSWPPSRK